MSQNGSASAAIQRLLGAMEDVAVQEHDGHLMLVRCTTGWQARFGWPMGMYENLGGDPGNPISVFDPEHIPIFDSPARAMYWALENSAEAAWLP